MKRFVIEVPDDMVRTAHPQTGASVISGPGTALVQNGMHGWLGFIPDAYVVSVEDVPDPLPTEPGAVFWGYGAKVRNAHEPCKWMVVLDIDADGQPDPARITYISQRYQEWSPAEAERYGLCVLPDPEATP